MEKNRLSKKPIRDNRFYVSNSRSKLKFYFLFSSVSICVDRVYELDRVYEFFYEKFRSNSKSFSKEINYRLQTTRFQRICDRFRNRSCRRYRVDGLFFFFFRCLLCREGKEKEGWRRRKDTRREIINSARTRVFFSPR